MADGRALTSRLVDGLYAEAMALADALRGHFDRDHADVRAALAPALRVALSCEALQATTRLMQAIAWLLTRRAVDAGEIDADGARMPERRLGEAPPYAPTPGFPAETARLLAATGDLYDRVARLDQGIDGEVAAVESPARSLLQRLERSF